MTFYCGPSIVCYQWLQVPTSRVYNIYVCLLRHLILVFGILLYRVQSYVHESCLVVGCDCRTKGFWDLTILFDVPEYLGRQLWHMSVKQLFYLFWTFSFRQMKLFPEDSILFLHQMLFFEKRKTLFFFNIFENNIIRVEAAKVLW
jgi:hypothetical protein